ncbi:MAG: hypothetical protein U0U67_00620 [Chitinophagales bacterium]
MKRLLLLGVILLTVAAFAQNNLTGQYACCRNTFMLTLKPNNEFTLVRNILGVDDSRTGTTTVKGKIEKTNEGFKLVPSTYQTVQKLYSKKKKKKIWMLMPTSSVYKKQVFLKTENDDLFWKQENDWQKLYKSE